MTPTTNSGIKLDQGPFVKAIDADKDGKVSKAEWLAIGAPEGIFSHTDKNNDGYTTVEEMNETTPPDMADVNKDGKLTLEEFQAWRKADEAAAGNAPPQGAPGNVPPQDAPVNGQDLARLKSYWHDTRIDYFETATEMGQDAAINVFGYDFSRDEGKVYKTEQPGTIALSLYWSEERKDNATIASAESIEEVLTAGAGYEKKAVEGYIYPTQQDCTVPLKLYYNPEIKDYYTTSTEEGEEVAKNTGYKFVRIEGYVFP
jgi:hypothetical protein